MDTFTNVTITKKANVYFDGKVTSRTLTFTDGSRKTLGIIQPGEYTFNTDAAERMEILAGNTQASISGGAWVDYPAGSHFDVPAHSSFSIRALSLSDYCCSFL
jgi:purine/pyrimidine-nucleoside phosphorylase